MLPEAKVLLSAARGDNGVVRDPCDEDRLLALAAAHQISGLVHWNGTHVRESARVSDAVESMFWHDAARNEHLREELIELQRSLEHGGVRGLVFKGPSLAFRAYPHVGARRVGDIDLCVDEGQFEAAVDVLLKLGYERPDGLPSSGHEALLQAHHSSQLRFTALGRRPVELHFRLVNLGPPHLEPWLWSTARELDIGGAKVLVPGPEALLFHLLLHSAQHGFAVLRLLHDVRFALAADADELDVETFLSIARPYRCDAVLYHGLALAASLAGATVPDALMTALDPGRLRRAWFERLWSLDRVRTLEAPLLPDEVEAPRLYLLGMGSIGGKLRYLRQVARWNGGLVRLGSRAASVWRRAPASLPVPVPDDSRNGPTAPPNVPARPALRPEVRRYAFESRELLYLAATDRTVSVPDSIRTLSQLCDGEQTMGQVVSAAARAASVPEAQILPTVLGVLLDLERGGFLAPQELI